MTKFTAFLLFALFLIGQTGAMAVLLTGGVEQSQYLPAVTPELEANVEQAEKQPFVEWFTIPQWMSGQWTKDGDLTISETDLRTGTTREVNIWTNNKMTRRFGHRLDRKGNIWWAVILPVENDGASTKETARFITIALKREPSTATTLITRTRYLITESFGWNNARQYQQEALNHFTHLPDGELQNRGNNRVFDLSGRPLRDGVLLTKWRRTGQFVNVKELNGIDLEKSLNQFLYTRGMKDLMTQPLIAADVPPPQPADGATAADDNSMPESVSPAPVVPFGAVPREFSAGTSGQPQYSSAPAGLSQSVQQVPPYLSQNSYSGSSGGQQGFYGSPYGQVPSPNQVSGNSVPVNRTGGPAYTPAQIYGAVQGLTGFPGAFVSGGQPAGTGYGYPEGPHSGYRLPGQFQSHGWNQH